MIQLSSIHECVFDYATHEGGSIGTSFLIGKVDVKEGLFGRISVINEVSIAFDIIFKGLKL